MSSHYTGLFRVRPIILLAHREKGTTCIQSRDAMSLNLELRWDHGSPQNSFSFGRAERRDAVTMWKQGRRSLASRRIPDPRIMHNAILGFIPRGDFIQTTIPCRSRNRCARIPRRLMPNPYQTQTHAKSNDPNSDISDTMFTCNH